MVEQNKKYFKNPLTISGVFWYSNSINIFVEVKLMRIKRKRIAEFLENKLKSVFLMTVYADTNDPDNEDEDDSQVTPKNTKSKRVIPEINLEDIIKSTRKEEKDKLYPRITKLENDLKETTTSLNKALREAGKWQQEAERLQAELDKSGGGDESKAVKELNKTIDKLNGEITALKESGAGVDEKEIRKQIEAEYAVKFYREQQISKNRNKILEVFDDIIDGKTNEEIDEAIKKAIEKSKSAKKQLGVKETDDDYDTEDGDYIDDDDIEITPAVRKKPQQTQNVPKRQPPVAHPASNNSKKERVTTDDIKNMSAADYREFRKRLNLK